MSKAKSLLIGIGLGAIGLAGLACSYVGASSIDVAASSSSSFGTLPELEFTDNRGQQVSPARLKGSVWVLSLLSTSLPGENREFLKRLLEVQEILGGTDTRIVSLSMNPLDDTPESLTALGTGVGADPDFWFFWTGSEGNTARLTSSAYRSALVGVDAEDMADFMVGAFESRVVAIDRDGQVRGTYDLGSEDGPLLLLGRLRQLAGE